MFLQDRFSAGAPQAARLLLGMLALLALTIGSLRADDLRVSIADGTTRDFSGAEVVSLTTDGQRPILSVVLQQGGAAYPVELERVIGIRFDAASGRTYSVEVYDAAGQTQTYTGVTLNSYSQGTFHATPAGQAQAYPIPAQNIRSIRREGAAPPPPPAAQPPQPQHQQPGGQPPRPPEPAAEVEEWASTTIGSPH